MRSTLRCIITRLGPWLRQTSTRTALLGMLALGVSAAEGVTTWRADLVPFASLVFGLVFSDTLSREDAERILQLALAGKPALAV